MAALTAVASRVRQPVLAGRIAVAALVGAVVVLGPLGFDPVTSQRFSEAAAYAVIGLGLNVLLGYVGQISLGHAAFVGVGAFASAYIVTEVGLPFPAGLVVAAAVGGLQAGLLGLVSLRVSGLYFALLTLVYGEFAQKTLFAIDSLTGGGSGQAAPNPFGTRGYRSYYLVCLGVLAAVVLVDRALLATKGGRALLALRENPRVAASVGVDVRGYTLFGFVVSGVYAGLGGALLAHNVEQVNGTDFEFRLALVFVIMTVVGGLRNRTGVIIGSVLFALLSFLIEEVPGLSSQFENADRTVTILLLVGGAIAAVRAGVAIANGRPISAHRVALGVGAGVALLALAVLLPGTVPGIEPALQAIPTLTPAIGRLVLGPALLLVVLTRVPGGIGQLVQPLVTWVSTGVWDPAAGKVVDVVIGDVRA